MFTVDNTITFFQISPPDLGKFKYTDTSDDLRGFHGCLYFPNWEYSTEILQMRLQDFRDSVVEIPLLVCVRLEQPVVRSWASERAFPTDGGNSDAGLPLAVESSNKLWI